MKGNFRGIRVLFSIGVVLGALSLPRSAAASGTDFSASKRGRCTGSASCSVCTNCSRCAWCSGGGGTCGVCGGSSAGRSERKSAFSPAKPAETHRTHRGGAAPASPAAVKTVVKAKSGYEQLPVKFSARVIRVDTGDRLVVQTGTGHALTFMLYGLQAPKKQERLFAESRQSLSDFTLGKTVTVYPRTSRATKNLKHKPDWEQADMEVPSKPFRKQNVGHYQLLAGMARWLPKVSPEQDPSSVCEQQARHAGNGIWKRS